MSVGSLSTSDYNSLFLEYIKPGLEKEFYINSTIYDRFKTRPETCLGKYGVIKVMSRGAQSARPSGTSTYPTALQGVYDEFFFYMKRGMYATLQFDGLALACGKGAGAVKDLVRAEVDGIKSTIARRLNIQFWGDGSGRLALIYGAISSSTTGYVDGLTHGLNSSEYTYASQYLMDGMPVEVRSSAGALEAEDITVTMTLGTAGVDTLTFSSAVTATDNGYIFHPNTYAIAEAAGTGVPMGLKGIISTSNQTVGITALSAWQGVNRSANTWAQAQVFNMGTGTGASSAALSDKKMIEVIQKVERFGKVDVIITNPPIWRNYGQLLKADVTLPNEKNLWGGHAGITFYAGKNQGIPIIFDEDCPDESMYFIDSDKIVISAPTKSGLDWDPGDSGNILTKVQGKDEYVANLKWYYNMTCKMPQALGLLQYIKHAES